MHGNDTISMLHMNHTVWRRIHDTAHTRSFRCRYSFVVFRCELGMSFAAVETSLDFAFFSFYFNSLPEGWAAPRLQMAKRIGGYPVAGPREMFFRVLPVARVRRSWSARPKKVINMGDDGCGIKYAADNHAAILVLLIVQRSSFLRRIYAAWEWLGIALR